MHFATHSGVARKKYSQGKRKRAPRLVYFEFFVTYLEKRTRYLFDKFNLSFLRNVIMFFYKEIFADVAVPKNNWMIQLLYWFLVDTLSVVTSKGLLYFSSPLILVF